jgi:hypothetical protein
MTLASINRSIHERFILPYFATYAYETTNWTADGSGTVVIDSYVMNKQDSIRLRIWKDQVTNNVMLSLSFGVSVTNSFVEHILLTKSEGESWDDLLFRAMQLGQEKFLEFYSALDAAQILTLNIGRGQLFIDKLEALRCTTEPPSVPSNDLAEIL